MCIFTEIKVVVIEQKLGQVEEFWNEFFNISHVVFSSRQPRIFDAVEHAVGEVKVSALTTNQTSTQLHLHKLRSHIFTKHRATFASLSR